MTTLKRMFFSKGDERVKYLVKKHEGKNLILRDDRYSENKYLSGKVVLQNDDEFEIMHSKKNIERVRYDSVIEAIVDLNNLP